MRSEYPETIRKRGEHSPLFLYADICIASAGARVYNNIRKDVFPDRRQHTDNKTKEQRSYNMSRIRSKNTSIENILAEALSRKGIAYTRYRKDIPGNPDFVLTGISVAVFCDSEFFHGYAFGQEEKDRLMRGEHGEFWTEKILRNRKRDREVSASLKGMGWTVVRFWGKEIRRDPDGCAEAVREAAEDILNDDSWIPS